MKKSVLIFTLLFLSIYSEVLWSQACGRNFIPNFRKGNTDLSFGIGFGSHLIKPGSYNTVPLLSVNVDHALRDDLGPGVIGVGGYFGYEQYRREYNSGEYGFNYSSVVLQGRITYHYQFIENFDTYGGLGLGIRYINSAEFGIHPPGDGIEPDDGIRASGAIFVGGRYFFNDKTAAYAELGYGVSYLSLGITFRL
jgi:hypothetical protein